MKKLSFAFIVLVIVIFAFKTPILRGIGNYLIYEDEIEKVDAIVILGGSSYDRGKEAINLYNKGIASKIITSGGNTALSYKPLGITLKEAEVTTKFLIDSANILPSNIITINTATSTKEEAETFVTACKQYSFNKVLVITNRMHTKRAKRIIDMAFENTGIDVLYTGASTNFVFDEQNWWKSEEGLIFVNNEWIKTFYYWIKY